uniref:Uncharacterized protein n=1 Tax=Nelumbo nucifera TaxID=4432 RepID=A0A822XFA6_NELNU|nr:TPA_asm: hypothetical protein HUJ06_020340 [Nelumbo nucifera]
MSAIVLFGTSARLRCHRRSVRNRCSRMSVDSAAPRPPLLTNVHQDLTPRHRNRLKYYADLASKLADDRQDRFGFRNTTLVVCCFTECETCIQVW